MAWLVVAMNRLLNPALRKHRIKKLTKAMAVRELSIALAQVYVKCLEYNQVLLQLDDKYKKIGLIPVK